MEAHDPYLGRMFDHIQLVFRKPSAMVVEATSRAAQRQPVGNMNVSRVTWTWLTGASGGWRSEAIIGRMAGAHESLHFRH